MGPPLRLQAGRKDIRPPSCSGTSRVVGRLARVPRRRGKAERGAAGVSPIPLLPYSHCEYTACVDFLPAPALPYPAPLRRTLLQSYVSCPSFLGPHLPVYLVTNALLLVLQVMQVQWFMGIIR